MEYTDYWIVRGDPRDVHDVLSLITGSGLVLAVGDFTVFVIECDVASSIHESFDWLLRVWDAEGSAWGFDLYQKGQVTASAEYGDSAEWGIAKADNAFSGDRAAAAAALGITQPTLEGCLGPDGVESFCGAVGFVHAYALYPHSLPDDLMLLGVQ